MVDTIRRLSVVGLGKLGACLAAVLADNGFEVVGIDVDDVTVASINRAEAPVFEPGLQAMIERNTSRLRATSDYQEAVRSTGATVILVPTPSEESGAFSVGYVLAAATELGRALRTKKGYHLVVLTSTVLPGATDAHVVPLLEAESGKRCGAEFGVCYSPEFIALGSVLRDMTHPDLLLIGESDQRAGDAWEAIALAMCENSPPVARMSFVNAELAKISVNTYVTMKISFANTLAALCEQLPGADVDVVTRAVGMDSRIGSRYLRGALGFGGPCFPRDNRAFAYFARELGQVAPLAEATDAYNQMVLGRVAQKVLDEVAAGSTVAVLGMAYKPETNVVEQSQGLLLARHLAMAGLRTIVYDSVARLTTQQELGDLVTYAESVQDAVGMADVVLIANPDPAYARFDLRGMAPPPLIVDVWRILRQETLPGRYLGLGLGPEPRSSPAAIANRA
jgi:UDPglucose 6-dehydrogenase